jgi:ribosome-associated toxin RatA of RatAB toxin-antitoxin module
LVISVRKLLTLAFVFVVQTALTAGLSVAATESVPTSSNPASIGVCEERISGVPYQVARVLIKATPADVWQVLTDYSSAASVFPTLKKCQVLSDKGNVKFIRYAMRPTGVLQTFQYDLEVKEQTNRYMEWHRISGDFKSVDGFWKLEPVECGRSTIVTHASYVNGGLFMPQALIKHQSRVDLPQVMAALKDRAERTMQIASHGSRQMN